MTRRRVVGVTAVPEAYVLVIALPLSPKYDIIAWVPEEGPAVLGKVLYLGAVLGIVNHVGMPTQFLGAIAAALGVCEGLNGGACKIEYEFCGQ